MAKQKMDSTSDSAIGLSYGLPSLDGLALQPSTSALRPPSMAALQPRGTL